MSLALRIASYNIRKAKGTDRRYDPYRIFEIIRTLNADIVVLQEADKRLPPRPPALPPKEVFAQTGMKSIEFDPHTPSLGWHGNAILIKEHFTVEAIQKIDLPGAEPRGAISCTLDIQGKKLDIVGLHLGLLRSSRRHQILKLGSLFKDHPNPTIMAGDFNEWSLKRGFENFEKHYSILSPGASFHSRYPIAHLDRFVTNHKVNVLGAGIQSCELSKYGSDHLPIWMTFEMH